MKKIGLASDHAGYPLKEHVKAYLAAHDMTFQDFGTHSPERCDYPDFAHPLAEAVEAGDVELGIGVCGSGEGISMTLNKHQGIRAALCWKPEIAALSRQHNDANVLVLPGRFVTDEEADRIMDAFFAAQFEGGRHTGRIAKISVR